MSPLEERVMTRTRAVVAAVAAAAVLGLVGLVVQRTVTRPAAPARVTAISAADLEARFGIRLTRVAVIATGGLVDLRFVIIDAQKAKAVLKDRNSTPTLIAEETGLALNAPQQSAMRNIRVQNDAACFVLFPNARGAIKPGTRVSLALGDIRVEPVIAL